MSVAKKEYKRVTVKSLVEMKQTGEKISMLTYKEDNVCCKKRIQKGHGKVFGRNETNRGKNLHVDLL